MDWKVVPGSRSYLEIDIGKGGVSKIAKYIRKGKAEIQFKPNPWKQARKHSEGDGYLKRKQ